MAIHLTSGKGRGVRTLEVRSGVYIDFDDEGRLVAVELLDASFHVPKDVLAKIPAPSTPLTLEQAPRESGLSVSTWRAMLNDGRVKGTKVGRGWTIEFADVLNYLKSRDVRARARRRGRVVGRWRSARRVRR